MSNQPQTLLELEATGLAGLLSFTKGQLAALQQRYEAIPHSAEAALALKRAMHPVSTAQLALSRHFGSAGGLPDIPAGTRAIPSNARATSPSEGDDPQVLQLILIEVGAAAYARFNAEAPTEEGESRPPFQALPLSKQLAWGRSGVEAAQRIHNYSLNLLHLLSQLPAALSAAPDPEPGN